MAHEVENVKVVVRLRPMSEEELDLGVEDCVSVDGQVLTLTHPSDSDVSMVLEPLTPRSTKSGPPKTPKVLPSKSVAEGNTEPFTPSKLPQTPTTQRLGANPVTPVSNRSAPSTPFSSRTPPPRRFAFDRIYKPSSSQEELFNDVASFVDAAVAGYNSTIFAYGQTGAGKTYTMMGPGDDQGIIPRAIRKIFDVIDGQPNRLFFIQVSYVELYLDKFVDLLDPEKIPGKKKRKLPSAKENKIEIHEDTKHKLVYLTGSPGLRTTITSVEQALKLITRGSHLRAVGATNLNEASSRSHAILTFHIESRDKDLQSTDIKVGKLHMVDLAGSERLNRSGAEGTTQKETLNINSSLTSLGDVLAALSSKQYNGPIPYRNSKLTRLLQDSLGGNSKTFFIINIQTSAPNYSETLMSLMYGQRAKKIKNITTLNVDTSGQEDTRLAKLAFEVETLRQRLIDRTKQFEAIKEQRASTIEENKQLKTRLDILSNITQAEIVQLEERLNDVIHSHQSELALIKYDYSSLQNGVEDYRLQIHRLRLELVLKEDEKESLISQMEGTKKDCEKLQQERDFVATEKAVLESELAVLQTREKDLQEKVAQLEKALEHEKNANTNNKKHKESETKQLLAELEATKTQVTDLKKQLNILTSGKEVQESKYLSKIEALEDSLKKGQAELVAKEREIAKLTSLQNRPSSRDKKAESDDLKSLRDELDAKQKEIDDKEKAIAAKSKEIHSIEKKLHTKEKELEQLTSENTKLSAKNVDLDAKCTKLKSKLQDANQKISELEQKIKELEEGPTTIPAGHSKKLPEEESARTSSEDKPKKRRHVKEAGKRSEEIIRREQEDEDHAVLHSRTKRNVKSVDYTKFYDKNDEAVLQAVPVSKKTKETDSHNANPQSRSSNATKKSLVTPSVSPIIKSTTSESTLVDVEDKENGPANIQPKNTGKRKFFNANESALPLSPVGEDNAPLKKKPSALHSIFKQAGAFAIPKLKAKKDNLGEPTSKRTKV